MALLRKAEPRDLVPGTIVGPYEVEARLGEGAMGTVYRASRRDNGDIVALKLIKPQLAGDERSRRRFLHEARAASAVRHKHLMPLLEAGEWEGRGYIAMRYIEGRTLEQRIHADGPLPIPEVVRLAGEVGPALDALHAAGVVHRDVKAANIMLEPDGSASLADFGLAKGPAFSSLTQPGQIVGTLDYLAPERIRGAAACASTDIYALGCVLYQALAGRPPFGGKSLMEVGFAILEAEPPDPCRGRAAPPHLSAVVLLALTKDPAGRPHTAAAYANLVARAARTAS